MNKNFEKKLYIFFSGLKFLLYALTVRQRADNEYVQRAGVSWYGGASGNRCARLLCARAVCWKFTRASDNLTLISSPAAICAATVAEHL